MVKSKDLIKQVIDIKDMYGINALYIISDLSNFIESFVKIENVKIKVMVSDATVHERVLAMVEDKGRSDITVRKIRDIGTMGLNLLSDAREIIIEDIMGGDLKMDDHVVMVINSGIKAIIYFVVREVGMTYLLSKIESNIKEKVLDSVLTLALEIAREGREGRLTGALFVVGDSDNVMKNSRQVIINPFKGHPKEARNVLNRENWETFKEFAVLDGAIIIDDDGIAQAAGRYVGISWDIYLEGGLGGRHLAAASISKNTGAVAITVSTSQVVRVFYKGKVIFKASII